MNSQFGLLSLHLHFYTKLCAKWLFIGFDEMFSEHVHQKVKNLKSASRVNHKSAFDRKFPIHIAMFDYRIFIFIHFGLHLGKYFCESWKTKTNEKRCVFREI